MKVKKCLAVLAAAGVVLFSQASISEAHNVATDKPTFTFMTRNDWTWTCDRCGKTVTFDDNPNYPPFGLAYGCPGTGGKNRYHSRTKNFGDRHYWQPF